MVLCYIHIIFMFTFCSIVYIYVGVYSIIASLSSIELYPTLYYLYRCGVKMSRDVYNITNYTHVVVYHHENGKYDTSYYRESRRRTKCIIVHKWREYHIRINLYCCMFVHHIIQHIHIIGIDIL